MYHDRDARQLSVILLPRWRPAAGRRPPGGCRVSAQDTTLRSPWIEPNQVLR